MDLGIEPRAPGLQRILNAQRRSHFQRTDLQAAGPDRSTGESQNRVDAHGPQERALAGHIRATDNQQSLPAVEQYVIANAGSAGEQRVAESFAVKEHALV